MEETKHTQKPRSSKLDPEKERALADALQLNHTAADIKERIKGNNIDTFKLFVKRLKLPPINTNGMNLNEEREYLLEILSQFLITPKGKELATGILNS